MRWLRSRHGGAQLLPSLPSVCLQLLRCCIWRMRPCGVQGVPPALLGCPQHLVVQRGEELMQALHACYWIGDGREQIVVRRACRAVGELSHACIARRTEDGRGRLWAGAQMHAFAQRICVSG